MTKKYLLAGELIDGVQDVPMREVGILIEDERIVAINPHQEVPKDVEFYDFSSKSVLPGLINAHTHIAFVGQDESGVSQLEKFLVAINELKQYLQVGVTAIRVCGASTYLDVQLRNAIREQKLLGPTIVAAGQGITMTGGSGHYVEIEADGCDACRKAARLVIKRGADFIKCVSTGSITTRGVDPGAPQLSCEELTAIVEEAHKAGKKVATHSHGTAGIINAINAGVDSIEHGSILNQEAIELMQKKGPYLVPTLCAPYFLMEAADAGELDRSQTEKIEKLGPVWFESFHQAKMANIPVAMGTDAFGDLIKPTDTAKELELMVQYGPMTPMEAIKSATYHSANLLGLLEQQGTLEKGKFADLFVINSSPINNISAIRDIDSVMVHGKMIPMKGCNENG